MKHILTFGAPPCAGKDTQTAEIGKYFSIVPLGDKLRERTKSKDLPLDIQIEMGKGKLLPMNEVLPIVQSELDRFSSSSHVLLNGFPRTREQAIFLIDELDTRYCGQDKPEYTLTVIALTGLTLRECLSRSEKRVREALERGEEPRKDDDPAVVKTRWAEWETYTLPMLDYVREKHWIRYFEVEATLPKNKVAKRIFRYLESLDLIAVEANAEEVK